MILILHRLHFKLQFFMQDETPIRQSVRSTNRYVVADDDQVLIEHLIILSLQNVLYNFRICSRRQSRQRGISTASTDHYRLVQHQDRWVGPAKSSHRTSPWISTEAGWRVAAPAVCQPLQRQELSDSWQCRESNAIVSKGTKYVSYIFYICKSLKPHKLSCCCNY